MSDVSKSVGFALPSLAPTGPVKRDPWRVRRKYHVEPWWYLCKSCKSTYTARGICSQCRHHASQYPSG